LAENSAPRRYQNVPIELTVAIVVLAALVAGVAWWASPRRRTDRLRTKFGLEYERTVEATDDRRRAEADLEAREERVGSFDIRPLSGGDRARFGERWRVVQALFVDDPLMAVEQADTLIGEVMRMRGYPIADFEQRAADVSVDHPQVVDHYRIAHRIADRRIAGEVDTEQLRQAFVHYRALFAELLETGSGAMVGRRATSSETALEGAASGAPVAEKATADPEAVAPDDGTDDRAAADETRTEPAEPARRP
jgi:hypothetical protein